MITYSNIICFGVVTVAIENNWHDVRRKGCKSVCVHESTCVALIADLDVLEDQVAT